MNICTERLGNNNQGNIDICPSFYPTAKQLHAQNYRHLLGGDIYQLEKICKAWLLGNQERSIDLSCDVLCLFF